MTTAPTGNSLLAALLVIATCGCGDEGGPAMPTDNFDRAAMLANLGDNLLVPAYTEFATTSASLATDLGAYCDAIDGAGETAALEAAQTSWRATMDAWQLAEAMLLGPAAMNERTLREQIYSWPLVSSCAVDQEVATYQTAPAALDITTKLNNRRGLDALAYLLFTTSLDHTCPTQTAPASWNDLSESERKIARCGYAAAAAADVLDKANIVVSAWTEGDRPFLDDLKAAGQSSSSFGSAQEAVNVVSDALFYLDTEVKTMKLGEPAGITVNSCATVQQPCEAELEAPFAGHSKQNIIRNLEGFSMLFHGNALSGTTGIGFDDFPIELGAHDLAATMSTDTAAALAAATSIPGTLREALRDDYDSVVSAHAATKQVTVALKSQFLTVLGLDLPDSAAGDND